MSESRPALTAGKSSFDSGTIYRVTSGIFDDEYGPLPDEAQRLDFRSVRDARKHAQVLADQYKAHVLIIQYKLTGGRGIHREHFGTATPRSRKKKKEEGSLAPPPIADCTWRPAATPPRLYGIYLGYVPEARGDRVWPVLWEGKWYDAEGAVRLAVTHWTPMPDAPQGRGNRSCSCRGRASCGRCNQGAASFYEPGLRYIAQSHGRGAQGDYRVEVWSPLFGWVDEPSSALKTRGWARDMMRLLRVQEPPVPARAYTPDGELFASIGAVPASKRRRRRRRRR